MSLSESIQAAIRDKLPEQVAGELRRYLEQARKDSEKVAAQAAEIEGLKKTCAEYERTVLDLNARVKREEAVKELRREVEARERAFDLEVAKIERQAAEQRADLAVNLVSLVFRNPRLTYTESVNSQVPVGVPSGGYVSMSSASESRTRTVEETK